MKKIILIALLVSTGFGTAYAQISKAEKVTIITKDLDRFWKAYDKAKPSFKAEYFSDYMENGTLGFKDFKYRIRSVEELSKAINKRTKDYEKIRKLSKGLADREKIKIEKYLKDLRKIYPNITVPDIYFVIGSFNTSSIKGESGIVIGLEVFSVMGLESLLPQIAFEIVHYQQSYYSRKPDLLGKSIIEGAANFVSELAIGENEDFSYHTDDYGFANEQELWDIFVKDMKNNSLGNWFNETPVMEDGPLHMGYWVGYQIVKAYYLKRNDKKAAVKEILNIRDFREFLDDSGYAEKFD